VDKISILIPTWNRDVWLEEALDSLQWQSFANWEAIIVDNGDGSQTKTIAQRYSDPRLTYIKAPRNLGECGGRNLAFAHSSGNFICYLDDDDLLPPDSLSERLEFHNQHRECGMIYGEYRQFQLDCEAGHNLREKPIFSHYKKNYYDSLLERLHYDQRDTYYFLKLFNFVRGGTPLIKRSTFETVGLFNEQLPIYGDYEMWLRIASRYPIRFLNKVVYLYRRHKGSISMRMTENAQNKQSALLICLRSGIRRSVCFACYQRDIDQLWATRKVE
jgi:glycosyltransferase involved in cell wall biosynthesis